MKKWKRLIWFIEEGWTRVHAVVGIDGPKTLCGIKRSTRRVGNKERGWHITERYEDCKKCQAVAIKLYGDLGAYTVPV